LQTSFYLQFLVAHFEAEIRQSKFEVLKPYFVEQCKDKNVCCCKYHVELDLLQQGFNSLKDGMKGAHVQNAMHVDV
jgi:hypothetical protein